MWFYRTSVLNLTNEKLKIYKFESYFGKNDEWIATIFSIAVSIIQYSLLGIQNQIQW